MSRIRTGLKWALPALGVVLLAGCEDGLEGGATATSDVPVVEAPETLEAQPRVVEEEVPIEPAEPAPVR